MGGASAVFVEALFVDVRQLDGVLDSDDLVGEPTDVLVRHIWDFFEHQFLDFRSDQTLEDQSGAGVHPDVVADPNELVAHRCGDLDDSFLVGAAQDDDAALVEPLLHGHDLSHHVELPDVDHVVGLVEQHFLADFERLDLDAGLDVHAKLATRGVDVCSPVFVDARAAYRRGWEGR